jgi:hypothetical protein
MDLVNEDGGARSTVTPDSPTRRSVPIETSRSTAHIDAATLQPTEAPL